MHIGTQSYRLSAHAAAFSKGYLLLMESILISLIVVSTFVLFLRMHAVRSDPLLANNPIFRQTDQSATPESSMLLGCAGEPFTSTIEHPRLWLTVDDLPRLRSWAVPDNPLFSEGLDVLATQAKADMDEDRVPELDQGSISWEQYPTEMYAELFAFMSLISNDQAVRDEYAGRARTLLMHVINRAAQGAAVGEPFRDPRFSTSNRSRWHGEAYALTVDWIYPYLTTSDKDAIRQVFLRWANENLYATTTSYNHPEPVCVVNDPILISNTIRTRFSANNYYVAHMRNIGLMSMALDPSDDPNGELRNYLRNATGAWLYVVDHLLRTDARGGLWPEGFEYGPQSMGYVAQFLLALHTADEDDPADWGPQVVLRDNPFWAYVLPAYLNSLSPAPRTHPWLGQVYQPAWYGDGQDYWATDFISVFGPLGICVIVRTIMYQVCSPNMYRA